MNQQRKVGIAETGVGLALAICLLVVIGYMVLHYLGGTSHTPAVEVRPNLVAKPVAGPDVASPAGEEQPQVLTIESSDAPGQALRTSPESELR